MNNIAFIDKTDIKDGFVNVITDKGIVPKALSSFIGFTSLYEHNFKIGDRAFKNKVFTSFQSILNVTTGPMAFKIKGKIEEDRFIHEQDADEYTFFANVKMLSTQVLGKHGDLMISIGQPNNKYLTAPNVYQNSTSFCTGIQHDDFNYEAPISMPFLIEYLEDAPSNGDIMKKFKLDIVDGKVFIRQTNNNKIQENHLFLEYE